MTEIIRRLLIWVIALLWPIFCVLWIHSICMQRRRYFCLSPSYARVSEHRLVPYSKRAFSEGLYSNITHTYILFRGLICLGPMIWALSFLRGNLWNWKTNIQGHPSFTLVLFSVAFIHFLRRAFHLKIQMVYMVQDLTFF